MYEELADDFVADASADAEGRPIVCSSLTQLCRSFRGWRFYGYLRLLQPFCWKNCCVHLLPRRSTTTTTSCGGAARICCRRLSRNAFKCRPLPWTTKVMLHHTQWIMNIRVRSPLLTPSMVAALQSRWQWLSRSPQKEPRLHSVTFARRCSFPVTG